MKQLILAGDVYQYRLHLKNRKINEEDAIFVMGVSDFFGRSNEELSNMITVGTWYKREYGNIMPIHRYFQSKGLDFTRLQMGLL